MTIDGLLLKGYFNTEIPSNRDDTEAVLQAAIREGYRKGHDTPVLPGTSYVFSSNGLVFKIVKAGLGPAVTYGMLDDLLYGLRAFLSEHGDFYWTTGAVTYNQQPVFYIDIVPK